MSEEVRYGRYGKAIDIEVGYRSTALAVKVASLYTTVDYCMSDKLSRLPRHFLSYKLLD
jgi:hypothetical protein